jgi:DNA-binding MarR family transcriptional regulator
MLQPEEGLVLDRLIHEPGRLAILTVLSSVRDADFVFLQRATGLTKGNLSSHLTKLEEAELVAIEKRFVRKKPNTNVALTPEGRRRIAHHWDQLERLKELSQTAGQLDRPRRSGSDGGETRPRGTWPPASPTPPSR